MRVGVVYRHSKGNERYPDIRFYQVISGCLHVSYGSGVVKTTVIYNQEDWEKIEVVGEGESPDKD